MTIWSQITQGTQDYNNIVTGNTGNSRLKQYSHTEHRALRNTPIYSQGTQGTQDYNNIKQGTQGTQYFNSIVTRNTGHTIL